MHKNKENNRYNYSILEGINETNNETKKDIVLVDSNNDGIPDEWSLNGFTVENGLIVKWNEEKHAKLGFTKYLSDPFKKSTTGDPFSDVDKVLGLIDRSISPEAHHPLVAAHPKIGIEMERLILSLNENITNDKGESTGEYKTTSFDTNTQNSHTDSISDSFSGSTGISKEGVNFGLNRSHSWDSSTTVTTGTSEGESESKSKEESFSKSLSLNKSEVAFLSGNIRYYNMGTAPIYYLKPTINFILDKQNDVKTIASIESKSNTIANVLNPSQKYPDISQEPITWNTMDDFNSQPIKLNLEQVKSILLENVPLKIQATQFSGFYKRYNLDGEVAIDETQKWELSLNDIHSRTALILIQFDDFTVQERLVSARKLKDYEKQTQPIITLGQALEIAFADLKIVEDKIQHPKLSNLHIDVLFNDLTISEIMRQKVDVPEKFFNLELVQGMQIFIKDSTHFDDEKLEAKAIFEKNIKWLQAFCGRGFDVPKSSNLPDTIDKEQMIKWMYDFMKKIFKNDKVNPKESQLRIKFMEDLTITFSSPSRFSTESFNERQGHFENLTFTWNSKKTNTKFEWVVPTSKQKVRFTYKMVK